MGDIDSVISELQRFKEDGFTHVIASSNMHGTAYSPSRKVPAFRLPMAIPENVAKENFRGTLSTVTGKGTRQILLVFANEDTKERFVWEQM